MVPDAKHVGVRIEAHTVKVSLDPKVGVELSERSGKTGQVGIVGRWADVDVDRGVPRPAGRVGYR